MLDVARVAAVLFALYAASRVRSRLAVLVAVVVPCAYALEIVSGLRAISDASLPARFVIALVFLGPSSASLAGLATSFVGAHPLAAQAATSALALVAFRVLRRKALALRPEALEARTLDRAALAFLFVVVLDVMLGVVCALGAVVLRD